MMYDLLLDPYLWLFVGVMLGIGGVLANALWRDYQSSKCRTARKFLINGRVYYADAE